MLDYFNSPRSTMLGSPSGFHRYQQQQQQHTQQQFRQSTSEYRQTVSRTTSGLVTESLPQEDEDQWTVHPTSRVTRTYSVGGDKYEEQRDSRRLYEELLRRQKEPSPEPERRSQSSSRTYHQTSVDILLAPPPPHRSEMNLYVDDTESGRYAPVQMTLALPAEPEPPQQEVTERIRINRKVNVKRTWKVVQTHDVAKSEASPPPQEAPTIPLALHEFKIALPDNSGSTAVTEEIQADKFQPVEMTLSLGEKSQSNKVPVEAGHAGSAECRSTRLTTTSTTTTRRVISNSTEQHSSGETSMKETRGNISNYSTTRCDDDSSAGILL